MQLQEIFSPVAGKTCSEFINPCLGDKVNSGIGLSYRHAGVHGWRAYTTPYAVVDFIYDLGIRLLFCCPDQKRNCYDSAHRNTVVVEEE